MGFEEQSKNRGRAEKSRLKKEGKLTESIDSQVKGFFKHTLLPAFSEDFTFSDKKIADRALKLLKKLVSQLKVNDFWIGEGKLTEDSLGDKFHKNIEKYRQRIEKEKEAYRKAKEVQKKRNEGNLAEKVSTLPPFEIAKKMIHSKYWQKAGKGFAKKVIRKFRGRGVSQKALDKWLPDYIDGKEISALFEGKLTEMDEPFWSVTTDKMKKPMSVRGKNKKDVEKLVRSMAPPGAIKWVKVVKEGKLAEAKETIFDVAARVVKTHQNEKWKGHRLDPTSANLLIKVFKKVNPKMKKILADLGNKDPVQLMNTLWAVVK